MENQEEQKWLIDEIAEDDKPEVQLVGQDGNAFSIIGRVMAAWRRLGRSDIGEEYRKRATAGDYNHLLQISMLYIQEDGAWGSDEEDEWYRDEDEEEDYEEE